MDKSTPFTHPPDKEYHLATNESALELEVTRLKAALKEAETLIEEISIHIGSGSKMGCRMRRVHKALLNRSKK